MGPKPGLLKDVRELFTKCKAIFLTLKCVSLIDFQLQSFLNDHFLSEVDTLNIEDDLFFSVLVAKKRGFLDFSKVLRFLQSGYALF